MLLARGAPAPCILLTLILLTAPSPAIATETVWIEAEHLDGIRGHCWPMGKPEMKKTEGHWGLSGPGWAAEWNMGGESGFLSIAAGADDDRAAASKTIDIPTAGMYRVWVRYGDWREKTERFEIQLEQTGAPPWTGQSFSPTRGSCLRSTVSARASSPRTPRRARSSSRAGGSPVGWTSTPTAAGP